MKNQGCGKGYPAAAWTGKMNFIYDWNQWIWIRADAKLVEKNSLLTLWECHLDSSEKNVTIPVIEYFNNRIFVPTDLWKDYAPVTSLGDIRRQAQKNKLHWVEMTTGRKAVIAEGLPM